MQIEKISPQLTSFSIGSRTQIQILASVTTWFKGKKKADARSIVEQFFIWAECGIGLRKGLFFLSGEIIVSSAKLKRKKYTEWSQSRDYWKQFDCLALDLKRTLNAGA